MSASGYFSKSYAEARQKFLDAAKAAGGQLAAYQNPERGPAGEALFTDTAWFGPERPERLLLLMSATHGVEGFLGSGIEIGWLANGGYKELPKGMGALVLHALNPFGFAWLRRTNENNVDLNRNFVDHRAAHPQNPGYVELRDAICPAEWQGPARDAAEARLRDYARQKGSAALQSAITTGQYVDPAGVFYGGQQPTWSNRTFAQILAPLAQTTRHIAVIDLHSGLGPRGYGEIINGHRPGHPGYRRVPEWFGSEATSTEDGSSTSSSVMGDTLLGIDAALPKSAVTGITLEYGTLPLPEMLDAVRADNWLHVHGRLDSPEGRAIKANIRAAFYQEQEDWKEMVWERGLDVSRRMVKALAES